MTAKHDWAYYAKQRQHLRYYQRVKQAVLDHSPGESLLDVGAGGTDTVLTGEFARRTAVNRDAMNVDYGPSVRVVIDDWMRTDVDAHQVVTCCQVIEHLRDAELGPFVAKLFALCSRALIVSVPYRWPAHICKYHPQDPIDGEKLDRIMGRRPDRSEIVTDEGHRRIIAEYLV